MLNTIINNALKTRNGLRFILISSGNKSAIDAINNTIAFLSSEVWFHSESWPAIVGRDEDGYPVEEWRESWFEELMNEGYTKEQAIERIVTSRIESVLHWYDHRFDEVFHILDEGLPF